MRNYSSDLNSVLAGHRTLVWTSSGPTSFAGVAHTGAHIDPLENETEKVVQGLLACVFYPWEPTCSLRGKFNPGRPEGLMLPAAALTRPGRPGTARAAPGARSPAGSVRFLVRREDSRTLPIVGSWELGSPSRRSWDRLSGLSQDSAPNSSGAQRRSRAPLRLRAGEGAGRGAEAPPRPARPVGFTPPLLRCGRRLFLLRHRLRRRPWFRSGFEAPVGGSRRGSGSSEERAARPLRPGNRWPRK